MGNKKSIPRANKYLVTLPLYTKAWDLLYSGDIEDWSEAAGTYGLGKFAYKCREPDCDRGSVCLQYIRATLHKCASNRYVQIERYCCSNVQIPYGHDEKFLELINADYELNKVAAAWRNSLVLLTLQKRQGFTNQASFPVVDLHTRRVLGILMAPQKNMTVIHSSFTPDCSRTAILLFSFSDEKKTSCYDLYLYSNETFQVLSTVTLNHEVQPYVAFDPRSKWSRVAVANYKSTGISNELVVFSLQEQKILVRSNLSLPILFGSSRFNLSYSKDGNLLILQKLTDNRFGVTAFSDIYIFNSDHIRLIKYLTANLPGLVHICKVNYEPVFSRCGSYMRVLDHKSNGEDAEVNVKIYQVPRLLNLQSQCRIIILQHITRLSDVNALPLPPTLKQFLQFQPILQ